MKKTLIIVIIPFLFSCQEKEKKTEIHLKPIESTGKEIETIILDSINNQAKLDSIEKQMNLDEDVSRGKKWLKTNIESAFNSDDDYNKILAIFTKQYSEFKSDAINVHYDTEDSLTPEQFKKKWEKIYNLQLTNNYSILIGLDDYEKVIVKSIVPTKTVENGFWYKITLLETSFNETIEREVRIVKVRNSFLIDEVLERD